MYLVQPAVILPFLVFFSLSIAEEELLCCNGWSDDVKQIVVSKHKKDATCNAERSCEASKCATEYGSTFNTRTGVRRVEDCFKWTPSDDDDICMCSKSWCNCPEALRNQQPKPKPTGLACCDNQESDQIKTETCPDTLPQPLGCTAKRTASSLALECGLGSRIAKNCTEYAIKNSDGPLQGTCYCQTNYCNCPFTNPPAKPPGPPKPPGSGRTETSWTTETTSNSHELKDQVRVLRLNFLAFVLTNKLIWN